MKFTCGTRITFKAMKPGRLLLLCVRFLNILQNDKIDNDDYQIKM